MPISNPLEIVLTESIVRSLAGEAYYRRGVDYFRRDRVQSLEQSSNIVDAIVRGTDDYAVRLSVVGKRFQYTCECPLGDEGAFCKHCVAAALAWLADRTGPSPSAPKPRTKPIADADIQLALQAHDKAVLIEWLLDWSRADKPLRQRLLAITRLRSDPAASVAQVRQQLQEAIKIRGYIEYRDAGDYAGRVHTALDELESLLRQGHAAHVIGLCEAADQWLENNVERVDDSNGEGTELMARIAGLHLQACEQAKPDPASLALRLFALEKNCGYGQWENNPEKYAHLLGEIGLAAFRDAAHKEWEKVPTRTNSGSYLGKESFYGITRIMESLARQSGDVEQLVAVLERDLTFAPQYVKIAHAYRAAGKHDMALDWAERGMATFLDRQGEQLRLFVAEEYRRAERHADALRILWSEFRASPDLRGYKLLEDFARAADDWDDWRDRALAHIGRTSATKGTTAGLVPGSLATRWNRPQGRSLLVEIFLHEQRLQDAWREAKQGGCFDHLWLQLAERSETSHPEDAIAAYLRLGEQAVASTSNGRYEPAIELLEKAAALMHRQGQGPAFGLWFDELRQRFKAKRNLQKLADARRQALYLQ